MPEPVLSKDTLAGCRALLIRPSSGDTQLQQQLSALGATWQHTPVMQLQRLAQTPQRVAALTAALQQGALALFVSRCAATIAVELAAQWPARGDYFAVGQSTAEVLRAASIAVQAPRQQQTSEGLLALPALAEVAGRHAIIVAGEGGRHLIGSELAARGAEVSRCELYRRHPDSAGLHAAQQQLPHCNLLLAHSAELLDSLGPAADPQLPLVVPSQRVAQRAAQLGYRQVAVARSANAAAMVAAAAQIWRRLRAD